MDDARDPSPLQLVRQASARIAELERVAAGASPPEEIRRWGMEQFELLRQLEHQLGHRASPNGAESAAAHAIDVAAALEQAAVGGDDPFDDALSTLVRLTGAQRGFIACREPGGALRCVSARAFGSLPVDAPEAQLSRSILELALRGQDALIIEDARDDEQLATPSVDRLALRSLLVVPLVAEARPVGVLYLDDPTRAAAFSDTERRAAEAFAGLVAPRLAEHLERQTTRARAEQLRRRVHEGWDLAGFVAESRALLDAVLRALRTARRPIPLLVCGPPGSGRAALCRLVHHNGPTASAPFETADAAEVAADPAAWAELLATPGATLVLRGVDSLPRVAQTGLATQLETVPVRARLCATASDPDGLVPQLEACVSVVEVRLPALQSRVEDIVPLAEHALGNGEHAARLSPAAQRLLESQPWPGNVTELITVARRAAARSRGELVERRHVLAVLRSDHDGAAEDDASSGLKAAVRAYRRRFVARVLDESHGDHARAARVLGVHPKYLYKLLRELREG